MGKTEKELQLVSTQLKQLKDVYKYSYLLDREECMEMYDEEHKMNMKLAALHERLHVCGNQSNSIDFRLRVCVGYGLSEWEKRNKCSSEKCL